MSDNPEPTRWRPAVYTTSDDPDEAGNPFIEALPPVWSKAELMEGLTRYLPNFQRMRAARPEVRLNALLKIRHYYQPGRRDVELAFDIVSTIRAGYLNRNPVGPNFVSTLKRGIAALADPGYDADPEPTATGIAVIGVSGVGKTTSVRIGLECLKRVIPHTEYPGLGCRTDQVVWHKLNCPKQGGIMKLCKDFVTSMDRLLGETYARKHRIRRGSKDDMESAMTAIAHAHGLGLLVIDEIQNLKRASRRDRAVTLTFLTSLMNGLGVPLLFVGTKDALPILRDAVPTARRTAGNFHRFERFRLDGNFALFMEGLWEYQLVDDPVAFDERAPNDPALLRGEPAGWVSLFYHYCQGVADIAVKLFVETQRSALDLSMKGKRSTITPELVEAVWNERFKLMHAHMQKLRKTGEAAEPDFGNALVALTEQLDASVGATGEDGLPQTEEDDNELPDGLEQPDHEDGEHPLSDDVGPHIPAPLSKTARAKALGTPATRAALARAASRPVKSTLAEIVAEGTAKGLTATEAITGKRVSGGKAAEPGRSKSRMTGAKRR